MTSALDIADSLRPEYIREDNLNSVLELMHDEIVGNGSRLIVRAGTPRLRNALTVMAPDGSSLIIFGEGLYALVRAFVKAATTYLPGTAPGSHTPSAVWPAAREALAHMLDHFSVPLETLNEPVIAVDSDQQRQANVYTYNTTRFVLCHEIAHVMCGHVHPDTVSRRRIGARNINVLRMEQQTEIEADRRGLALHVGSISDPDMHAVAIGSAVYFLSVIYLLTFRLALLGEVVRNLDAWDVEEVPLNHPPVLQRAFMICSSAERLSPGIGSALDRLRQQLFDIVHMVFEAACKQQQSAITATMSALSQDFASPHALRTAIVGGFATSRSGVLIALKREIVNGSKLAESLVRDEFPEAREFFERYSPGLL